jgi:hypothetical protein
MTRPSKVRLAVAALVAGLGAAVVLAVGRDDPASESAVGGSAIDQAIEDGLLVRTPRGALETCRSAASQGTVQARCPAALPVADWGRGRALDSDPCEYLVELLAGPSVGGVRTRFYHLLFGGRCGRFDLAVRNGEWPLKGFIANDLRLVGVLPLKRGQSGRGAPDRLRVLDRFRIAGRPALLLRHAERPLTSVHTGHLALVWNEASDGYTVSGHLSEAGTAQQEEAAIRALRATALALHMSS